MNFHAVSLLKPNKCQNFRKHFLTIDELHVTTARLNNAENVQLTDYLGVEHNRNKC